MSTPAAQVARSYVAPGTVWEVARNRDHTTGAGALLPQDLGATTDRPGVWLQWTMLAGFPVAHGEVADESAMLALHTFGMDSADNPSPHYVAPGDSCTRADDPGWRWHCIAGHGTTIADWERRPLAGALTGLAVSGHTHTISAVTGLQTALNGKQATLVNAAALARISAVPAGPLLWDGAEISGGSSSGAQYTAPSMHFIATAALAADGSTPADGAAVAALLDSSGHGLAASQATAANRPIFRASAINGQPAIEFPAGQFARLEIPSLYRSDWVAAGGMEMIAVLRRLAAGVTCPFVWYTSSSGVPVWVLTHTDGLTYYDWVDNESGRVSVSGSISTSLDWMILGCRRASGRSVLSLNGVDVTTGAYNQLLYPPTTAKDFSLGSSGFSGNCQLAEILFWPGALSLAERAGRVAALASQYGLAL